MDYNKLQADLIIGSEKAHFYGLRSTSLTGTYNELLLVQLLRKFFPKVGFGRGNIVMETEQDGFVTSRKYKQVDILCYRKGKEYFELGNLVTIKKSHVYLAIEVKKWCSPKSMENLRESISRFEKEYVIKMFGVVFRIWRSRSFNLRTIGKKTGLYVFSHSSKKANEWLKPNHLIRQLKRGLNVRDIIYEGEMQRLVDDIKDIIAKREIKRSNTL